MAALFKRKLAGKLGETAACQFLQTKGLRLIEHNYALATGEIDLIMQDKKDIVFIEVRTRSNNRYGTTIESVNYHKQTKLIKTALYYMQKNRLLYKVNCRFDIIGITTTAEGNKIDWVKNAFTVR